MSILSTFLILKILLILQVGKVVVRVYVRSCKTCTK